MPPPALTPNTVAGVVARFLKSRQVDRLFALCGGHIMPIRMRVDAEGIDIVDVRDERAAVYMAHAYGELTGSVGVALVTAGPGMTNAMTGIANAHIARAPLLVLCGRPPLPQSHRGSLQDLPHVDMVRPITRFARTLTEPELVVPQLDEAVSCALGEGGDPGPAFIDFPTDTLRAEIPEPLQFDTMHPYSSSWQTTAHGKSRYMIKATIMAKWWAPGCRWPTTPLWRAVSECMLSALNVRKTSHRPSSARYPIHQPYLML